jgi:hypothetical protein
MPFLSFKITSVQGINVIVLMAMERNHDKKNCWNNIPAKWKVFPYPFRLAAQHRNKKKVDDHLHCDINMHHEQKKTEQKKIGRIWTRIGKSIGAKILA